MKNSKYLSRGLLLPVLITSFFMLSGCYETIEVDALEQGDTWCTARSDIHNEGHYTTSVYSTVYSAKFDFGNTEVPCRWLASSSAPIPTQAHHVEKDRFDVSGAAYLGKAVGNNLEGLWLVIESRSENPYYKPSQPEHSIFNRYTCELSLNESGELMSSNLCPLISEAKAPIIFDSDTQTLKSVWEEVESKDTKNEVTVTYTLDTSWVEAGILTGSLTNVITEDLYWEGEDVYLDTPSSHPVYFQLVRIGDKGKKLGEVKLRDRALALADATTPFTKTYPVTGFYEHQQGNVWQLKFKNNDQTVLEASGQNAFAAIRGSLIERYSQKDGMYWEIYNPAQALRVLMEEGSGNINNEYYGLFLRKYGKKALSPRTGVKMADGAYITAFGEMEGEEFYAGVGGIAPIQQKFASFPYGERAPWEWLMNGKTGINVEFYYHDEVIEDMFYVPVNTNINYEPYTDVEPDSRASVKDIGNDIKIPLDENGSPVGAAKLVIDADTVRKSSVKKLQQVVIDIEIL